MNILLTCAGRRNYLVKYFKEALSGQGLVFAADNSWTAPAFQEADRAFIVPKVSEKDYAKTLLSICKENEVKAIIPLNDLELPVLAANKKIFEDSGIFPVVSDPSVIEICFDKLSSIVFAQNIGLRSPNTCVSLEEALSKIREGLLIFPLVVKPRWGSASICIEFVENEEELRHAFALARIRLQKSILAGSSRRDEVHSLLIQEKIAGQEYGLDIVNDMRKKTVAVFIKKKHAMRAGETDKATTVRDEEIEKVGWAIGNHLGHIGNLDCDIFKNDKGVFLLEMNPRFGGGYPFSHVAGASVPSALISWLKGEKPRLKSLQIRENVTAAKYDQIVCCNPHEGAN